MPSDWKQPPRKKRRPRPMRRHSLTNKVAKVWREVYVPRSRAWLLDHPWCEMHVPGICPPGAHPSTEVQHTVQRSLDPSAANLLDESRWKASCHAANSWAAIHPQEAIALGVEVDPRAARRGIERD